MSLASKGHVRPRDRVVWLDEQASVGIYPNATEKTGRGSMSICGSEEATISLPLLRLLCPNGRGVQLPHRPPP